MQASGALLTACLPTPPHANADSLTNHHYREPDARAVTHEEHTHARVQRMDHHVDETAQFAPGKNPNEPTFVITDVGIENGTMYAFIVGGWPEGYPGWIKDSLYVGERSTSQPSARSPSSTSPPHRPSTAMARPPSASNPTQTSKFPARTNP